jgi:hypothetical protein
VVVAAPAPWHDAEVTVALAAVSASAVIGLLATPVERYVSWVGTVALLLLGALGFAALLVAFSATEEEVTLAAPVTLSGAMVVCAWRILRGRRLRLDAGGSASDPEGEDESGGGGGGLRKPPDDPPPAPPAPGLDWDAFDDARESWGAPEPALR